MDAQYNTSVVLELQGVSVYEIKGKYQKVLNQGIMQVLEIEEYGLTFLKLDGFQYTLQKNIPVMTQLVVAQNGQNLKMYVLPCVDQFYYGVVIDLANNDISVIFESIIAERCQLVKPSDEAFKFFQPQQSLVKQQTMLKQQTMQDQKPAKFTQEDQMRRSGVVLVKPEELVEQVSSSGNTGNYGGWGNVGAGQPKQKQNVSEYIIKGGELMKDGLIYGAKVVSQGVVQGGQYIQSKITTPEQKNIDQATFTKIKIANTGSKAMLMYTKAQVEALVNMGKMVGEEAAKSIGQSETGKKIQSHKNYDDAKEIGLATIYAFATVYDGLYQAIGELGSTCAQTTTEIINQKYGKEAGDLSRESFEVAGNVGQIMRVYKDVAAKAIIQEGDKQKQIH